MRVGHHPPMVPLPDRVTRYDLLRYWIMSHHPSSAELAAFRRSIQEASAHPSQHDHDRDTLMGHPTATYNAAGVHAWPDELRDGIGSRGYLAGASASFDRREASALHSRAYARGIRSIPYSYSAKDAGQDAIERFVSDSPEGQNLIRAGYRLAFGYMDPGTTVAVWTS